jgi:hypothetical protein
VDTPLAQQRKVTPSFRQHMTPRGGFSSPAALGNNTNCRPPPHDPPQTDAIWRIGEGGEVVMGRSRCRRGRQYGDEWQRQHGGGKLKPQFNGATISFVFLKCQKKTPIFIFSQKICRPLKSAALGGRLVRLMVKPPLMTP